MSDRADFKSLVNRAMAAPGHAHMRPVVEKELLHYDILFSLENAGLLKRLTFQGGTALRLCYGAFRYSEDLDFAGGVQFSSAQAKSIKTCLEEHIGQRYGLEVRVKEPAELQPEPSYKEVSVTRWQISVITEPERKDLPHQKIRIEIAGVPAWTREPRALQVNYDFLPDGYGDVLIMTETLDEVMADKLVSLVNTTRHVRHRDIWDLRWLKQQGATVDIGLIRKKISDYQVERYTEKLESMLGRLADVVHGEAFNNEMRRFLPLAVQERTLAKEAFHDFLASEVGGLLKTVKQGWESSGSP